MDSLIIVAQAAGGQDVAWWEVVSALSPLATLLAATIAGTIAWQALKQRSLADRRGEWWGRAQWALNAALSEDPALKETGLGILGILATSSLATDEEIEILSVAAVQPLAQVSRPSALPEQGPAREQGPGGEQRQARAPETQDRIVRRAAKLQVVTDRRLDRPTEEWIRRLAADPK
ncbi:hypothetical protein [Arthrobacter mangrovi]|uniref:Uncharacterized protein n=1 Tax=Arthrobacter mangrovi TaxID=2966350 RepID=A0ABQ5MVC6_9MICC|nr:hypothetical protein [Arthrobacter mangrovi]GLB67941.1 hypothetical protein AHIS1636_23820 [Arthrobacter mangrovi]